VAPASDLAHRGSPPPHLQLQPSLSPRRLPELTRLPTSSSTVVRPPTSRYAVVDPTRGQAWALGKVEGVAGASQTSLESVFSGRDRIAFSAKLFFLLCLARHRPKLLAKPCQALGHEGPQAYDSRSSQLMRSTYISLL
jgi:hypothetical protein